LNEGIKELNPPPSEDRELRSQSSNFWREGLRSSILLPLEGQGVRISILLSLSGRK